VVIVTAEPGLGKTRLVQECHRLAQGNARPPLWLEGRCASYASSTPYSLYQQLLANWAGVTPDLPEAVVRPALEKALSRVKGTESLLPVLARMMGLSSGATLGRKSPGELQRETFQAWRSLISLLAGIVPTVLVLEDLHWADPTSLRLTLELASLTPGRRLVILATTRPGAGPEIGALERSSAAGLIVGRLTLDPLPSDAERVLATSLIGERVGQDILDAVLTSVDGNPLFLEERLSSLLETNALVREQGTWRMSEAARQELPQALERLVLSRVDRLSPAARGAIRHASVLGFEFPLSLLAAVYPTDQPLERVLDELRARDLLHDVPGLPEPAFCFRHALIQEATYHGLLRAERRTLHGRAGWALEAASAGRLEEVAAVLGRHFAAAGETDRALLYLEMAGDHATGEFANDEAISSFRAALAIAREQPAGVELRAKLANVLWRTARRDQARQAFLEALDIAGGEDAIRRAHLLTRLGRLELDDLRYEAAADAFGQAQALLGDDPGAMDAAAVEEWLELMLDGWAALYGMSDKPALALATVERARPVLAMGTPPRRYSYYMKLAYGRCALNRYRVDETDITDMRKALAAASQSYEEKDGGYASYFLGRLLWLRGDLAEAQEYLEQALAMAERIGESVLLGMSLLGLALNAIRRHDAQTVRTLAPRALAAATGMARLEYLTGVKASLAWLAWQDHRPGDVLKLAEEVAGIKVTADGGGSHHKWVYLWPLLAVQLDAGRLADAVAAARQLLDATQQRLPENLEAAVSAAVTAWESDDAELTEDKLATALELARDLRYA
jgi:tetratricopeptide (TPR) repeat protein